MILAFAEAGGTGEGEFEGCVELGLVPDIGVGGGGDRDLPIGNLAGSRIETQGERWSYEPSAKPVTDGSCQSGDLPLIRSVGGEQELAIAGRNFALEAGNGKRFFVLSIVELLRKCGVGAADAIEEPTVEGGGVLGGELDVGLGLDCEGDTDEFGLGWDGEARGFGHCQIPANQIQSAVLLGQT